MEYKEEFFEAFSKYKDREAELKGKLVLYEHGFSYKGSFSRSIVKIASVHKTGFRIEAFKKGVADTTMLFDWRGEQKGLHRKMDMGRISRCKILTVDGTNAIRDMWRTNRMKKDLLDKIKGGLSKIEAIEADSVAAINILKKLEVIITESEGLVNKILDLNIDSKS